MTSRSSVRVPKFLHEIHGQNPTPLGIVLTYLAAVLASIISALMASDQGLDLWKIIVIAVLFFDIGGGVVANMTSSTNTYYQKSPGLRAFYLIIHLIQPLAIAIVLNMSLLVALSLAFYVIALGFALGIVKSVESQQTVAATAFVGGVCMLLYGPPAANTIFLMFGVLYMTKLIIGFSVKRPVLA